MYKYKIKEFDVIKNYSKLAKRNLKGVVSISTAVIIVLLMNSCFTDKKIENKQDLNTISENANLNSNDNKTLITAEKSKVSETMVIKDGTEKSSKSETMEIEGKTGKAKEAAAKAVKGSAEKSSEPKTMIIKEKVQNTKTREHNLLIFGNSGFDKINYSSNKNTKHPTDPVTPNKPDPVIPITPEKPVIISPDNNLPIIPPPVVWINGKPVVFEYYTLRNDLVMISGEKGLLTTGGTIVNESVISGGDKTFYAMSATNGGTAINDGTISNNGYGMYVSDTSTAANYGMISNNAVYGMVAYNGGTAVNEKDGTINNNDRYGMYSYGTDSTIINRGIISNNGNYGMSVNGGTATNYGKISNTGSYGMYVQSGGTAVNEKGGIISNTGNYRMFANSGGTAINYGSLNTGSDDYTVMGASGTGSVITNNGTINVNHDNSTAMAAVNGGRAVNNGTINLNADNGIGILVDGAKSSYVNKGTINIKEYTYDNQEIVLQNGAAFYNSGSIVSDGSFNTDEMGDGKFVMDDGGTLEAESIEGDIYASGALAMGGYDDMYSTYKMLKTDDLQGEIISDAAMFDAHFTENADENGYYDVVLERKDFNTIISNDDLGRILEDNYKDDGNETKEDYYDALKLVSTEDDLDKAAEDSYGMSFYPSLAKQTFEIIHSSNQVITDNVIKNQRGRNIGETIAIAGADFNKFENDSYDNVSGYETDLSSIYLGAEKQLTKTTRIGGIATIGRADTSSTDTAGSREDYYYQGNAYLTYENKNRLKFTSMVFAGMTDTSVERTLEFGSIYETMTDDINNYYVGINNELSKKYDMGKTYIEPKLEFNVAYMRQDDISESGKYSVDIDGANSVSVETGIGVAIGRDFYLDNGNKFNIEGGVTGYAELGNPYKDLNSTFGTLSREQVKMDGYNSDDFYGDIMAGGSYQTKDSLNLYTKIGYRIGNISEGFIGKLGLNYLF